MEEKLLPPSHLGAICPSSKTALMMETKKILLITSALFSLGLSQTTTAPAQSPAQTPPTSTVYSYTASFFTGFPCAGSELAYSSLPTYPVSLCLNVLRHGLVLKLIREGFRVHNYSVCLRLSAADFIHMLVSSLVRKPRLSEADSP